MIHRTALLCVNRIMMENADSGAIDALPTQSLADAGDGSA
jgi:hypothetical protein